MRFTVTMECSCGKKIAGQGGSLVSAIEAFAASGDDETHHMEQVASELKGLEEKASRVTMIEGMADAVGKVLGVDPAHVQIMRPMTQEQFEAFLRGEFKPGAPDGEG